MRRPAIRIILAPLQRFEPTAKFLHGMQEGRTIYIDPRSRDLVNTFVHERLHLDNPSRSEQWVRRETAKEMRRMGWRERAEIIKLLGHGQIRSAEEVGRS